MTDTEKNTSLSLSIVPAKTVDEIIDWLLDKIAVLTTDDEKTDFNVNGLVVEFADFIEYGGGTQTEWHNELCETLKEQYGLMLLKHYLTSDILIIPQYTKLLNDLLMKEGDVYAAMRDAMERVALEKGGDAPQYELVKVAGFVVKEFLKETGNKAGLLGVKI